jgi:hypothetical protein
MKASAAAARERERETLRGLLVREELCFPSLLVVLAFLLPRGSLRQAHWKMRDCENNDKAAREASGDVTIKGARDEGK